MNSGGVADEEVAGGAAEEAVKGALEDVMGLDAEGDD